MNSDGGEHYAGGASVQVSQVIQITHGSPPVTITQGKVPARPATPIHKTATTPVTNRRRA